METNKRYGLQVPRKPALGEVQPRHSVFGDDSDSEHEDGSDWVKKAFSKAASKSVQKKQTKLEIQRALEEDPTVYQYDEIYEQLEEKKQEAKSQKTEQERKPRYIQTLMAHAEQRKREQERRMERQVQKEREAEGEAFKDKEAFITSSYRKKLEEFRKLDEEERRRDELEAIGDVSKQEDLSGFYRHLYHQTLGDSKPVIKQEKDSDNEEEAQIEREKVELSDTQSICVKKSDVNYNNKRQVSQVIETKEHHKSRSQTLTSKAEDRRGKTNHEDTLHMTDQTAVSEMEKVSISCSGKKEEQTSKHKLKDHDKSKQSPPSEISHNVESKKQHTDESNQDADTEISSSSSSSSSESGSHTVKTKIDSSRRKKKQTSKSRQYRKRQSSSSEESGSGTDNEKSPVLLENRNDKNTEVSTEKVISTSEEKASELNTKSAPNENKVTNGDFNEPEKENKNSAKKEHKSEKTKKVPDLSIYEKRTVGAKFEEARQRYLERKAAREAKNIFF